MSTPESEDGTQPQSIPDDTLPSSSDSSGTTAPDMVCALCGEPLYHYQEFDGDAIQIRHPLNAVKDHEPVPIPRADAEFVLMYCDFCASTDVTWIYQTRGEISSTLAQRNFATEIEEHRISRDWMALRHKEDPATELAVNTFSQGWAACDRCAELIELRDMERLITHIRRTNERFARMIRTVLREHFVLFFRAIGPREPVTPSG